MPVYLLLTILDVMLLNDYSLNTNFQKIA